MDYQRNDPPPSFFFFFPSSVNLNLNRPGAYQGLRHTLPGRDSSDAPELHNIGDLFMHLE